MKDLVSDRLTYLVATVAALSLSWVIIATLPLAGSVSIALFCMFSAMAALWLGQQANLPNSLSIRIIEAGPLVPVPMPSPSKGSTR